MEDDKKTKDTNGNGKNKIECPCGGYFLKRNHKRHLTSNMHKNYLDSNFVCVSVRKGSEIYNEDGLKIIKSKGRPAINIPEYHKKYMQNPENKIVPNRCVKFWCRSHYTFYDMLFSVSMDV